MSVKECECTEPGWCERHQIGKTAHMFRLCQTMPVYRNMWDAGRGPGQEQQTDEEIARIESRQSVMLAELRPIAKRLADETGERQLLTVIGRYDRVLRGWHDAGYPVRTAIEQRSIEKECAVCKHVDPGGATCDRCGAKGQLISVIAYMANSRCPIRNW